MQAARNSSLVAVTSRSFSQHPKLTAELRLRYSNVRLNEAGTSLQGDELIAHLQGAERAIVALERIDDGVLRHLPDLKIISKYGVGIDNIDLPALHARGIKLGWTGGVNRRSVAELALSLMIAQLRLSNQSRELLLSGRWKQLRGRQLTGKTVGIVGLGHVGRDLVGLLKPFGCRIIANDIRDVSDFAAVHNIDLVDKPTLFAESDIITLHTPRTPETYHMINADVLSTMKPDAILINTARGGLVDEAGLASALKDGVIAGAACDVFEIEPPADNTLLRLPNFFPTTHIGGSSEEAVLAMGRAAIETLQAAVDAEPKNFGY